MKILRSHTLASPEFNKTFTKDIVAVLTDKSNVSG